MKQHILVWDLPTRLCHWLIALSVLACWATIELLEEMQWHFYAGYSLLSLVLFRITWGFIGTHHARFKQFFYPVAETLNYAKNITKKNSRAYLGHNPIGSLSALLMLTSLLVQAVTGLFNSDNYFFGPLNSLVSDDLSTLLGTIHEINFEILEVLIAVHITAIIFYRVHKKQKLSSAMLHGKKEIADDASDSSTNDLQSIDSSKLVLALIVFIICAGCIYGLVSYFEQALPVNDFDPYS